MISTLLAAAFTFTATATGVEKGTPLEFMFAAADTDRDYETVFLIDEPIDSFLSRLEKAGIPRGKPTDQRACRLWPVGVPLKLEPAPDTFVETDMPEGLTLGEIIYTGGTRFESGCPEAVSNMPSAVFSLYTLAQSPILFNGIYEQGVVYGAHKVKQTLKKGDKKTFRLIWDEKSKPLTLNLSFHKGNLKENLTKLKDSAVNRELDVLVEFSDDLTVIEATAVAQALATVDSSRVKINGRKDGDFFFRAFLPLVKWRDRQERLTQPFEIHLGSPNKVLFIEEDWTVEGTDPKLTEKAIDYESMKDHPQTDTVFFYARKDTTLGELKALLKNLPKTVINHYVYWE